MPGLLADLEDDILLQLFHRGARAQWTSQDLDWLPELRFTTRQRRALARLLTPIYFGERTAMAGATAVLPALMHAGETTAQLYLTSFMFDEARHFEALTRLYAKLGFDPLGLRDMPELLRYFHRLRDGDRADWVWGILISDINAKHFYRAFGTRQGDPFFAGMSQRILIDESRHLAFAESYLKRNLPHMTTQRRRALLQMRDDLFRLLERMVDRVEPDAAEFEVHAEPYLRGVWSDIEAATQRIGLTNDPPRRPGAFVGVAPRVLPTDVLKHCGDCLVALLCARRLAPA